MAGEWLTATGASQALGISERTLRRRAKQGLIESKLENNRRLFWVDTDRQVSDTDMVEQLRAENEYLKQQIEAKDTQISELHQLLMAVEARSERLLEYYQVPWYRRLFRRRRSGE